MGFWSKIPFIRRSVLKDAYSKQSKPKGFENKTFVFTDSKGRRYYKFDSMNDIPIMRREQIDVILDEMTSKMTYKEKNKFVDTGLTILGGTLTDKEKISNIHWLFNEFKNREEMLFHPDCMFRMVSAIYIREDQDAAIWDDDLENEKIIEFKEGCKHEGGLHDFFYSATLKDFFPFLDGIEKIFAKYSKSMESLAGKQMKVLDDLQQKYTPVYKTKGH